MPSVLENLSQRHDEKTTAALTEYISLVRKIGADGEPPGTAIVEGILLAASKTVDDFQNDVEAFRRRSELRKQLVAGADLEAEAAKLAEQQSEAFERGRRLRAESEEAERLTKAISLDRAHVSRRIRDSNRISNELRQIQYSRFDSSAESSAIELLDSLQVKRKAAAARLKSIEEQAKGSRQTLARVVQDQRLALTLDGGQDRKDRLAYLKDQADGSKKNLAAAEKQLPAVRRELDKLTAAVADTRQTCANCVSTDDHGLPLADPTAAVATSEPDGPSENNMTFDFSK